MKHEYTLTVKGPHKLTLRVPTSFTSESWQQEVHGSNKLNENKGLTGLTPNSPNFENSVISQLCK